MVRGGSWNTNTRNTRTANRNRNTPDNRNNNNGFRVVSESVSTLRVAEFSRSPLPEPVDSRIVWACESAVHRATPRRFLMAETGPMSDSLREVW